MNGLRPLSLVLSSRQRFTSVGLFTFALGAFAFACGGKDDNKGGDGDGDATGGAVGDGDGDGSGGNGDGDGSGGSGTGGGTATTNFNCTPAAGAIPTLALEEVETGFNEPVLVTHAGDERLFVVERGGEIHIIEDGSTLPTPFIDLTSEVNSSESERGLLGLAFHPDHKQNGLFYVYYTAAASTGYQNGASILAEYSVSESDSNIADTSTERVLLDVNQPGWNHNGGTVIFGPDGMLYWGLGDGGGSNDQYENGQDETTLLGALLRIDPNGREEGQYSIPSGNLSEALPNAAPEIYSYGLRNPYRFSFDDCTGDLYIGDVGQDEWEEVTVTPAGVGHVNYGWNTMEGKHCFNPPAGCSMAGLTQPQIEYARGESGAVIGGAVYRGSEIPALRGKYFYSDTIQSHLWYAEYNASANTVDTPTNIGGQVGGAGGIVSIETGFDGEIYMAQRATGQVLKLVALEPPN